MTKRWITNKRETRIASQIYLWSNVHLLVLGFGVARVLLVGQQYLINKCWYPPLLRNSAEIMAENHSELSLPFHHASEITNLAER